MKKYLNMKLIALLVICSLGCSEAVHKRDDLGMRHDYHEISIHFIDVGLGDCTLIILPNKRTVLIDAGSPAAGPEVVKYLRTAGLRTINHLIITHAHDDHFGGIFNVMAEFEVMNFYDNGFSNFQSTMFGDYVSAVRQDLKKYRVLQAGETLDFGEVTIDVLNPLLPPSGNLNNDSLVMKVHHGSVKLLLAADLGDIGERRLLNIGTDLESDVLKVGHHGEDDSSLTEFIESVNPDAAIVSVSRINKYARPHRDVLKRLRAAGSVIYRTDSGGSIVMTSTGSAYEIESDRAGTEH